MRPQEFPKSGTITVTQLRKQPGEYLNAVSRSGEAFLITSSGKPVARLVPVDESSVILPDGSCRGPYPLTMGQNLGG